MNWRESYVGFLNMDHRLDRLEHIKPQLEALGIPFERTRGKRPEEYDLTNPAWQVMVKRTAGALPCHYGQVEIMQKALAANKDAMVFEDDCMICSDIKDRLDYIQEFLNKQDDWDIFWLGGTVHINPPWWHIGGKNPDLPDTTLTRDCERTDDARIVRTYGAFCTYAYIVRKESIQKILDLLESVVHLSMGIDWAMIKLQPQLKTFMLLPGSVKQIDNMSDIGHGMTVFSGFAMLGPYWWADKIDDFNPETFNWQ